MPKKVIIIGLDAVDSERAEDFIGKGYLPNIKRLKENGSYGRLRSTIPAVSNVCWTSFITGKNPGKHNTFGYLGFKENTYQIKSISSLDRASETVWHILNRYGKKTGIINLPSLYPPEKIDGFMVCGMLTPKINTNFIYPESLQEELLTQIKGYNIDIGTRRATRDKDILLEEIYEITKKRSEAMHYLARRFDCDLFLAVFTGTDRIQHFFWRDMQGASKYKDAIADYFRYIDSILGDFIKDMDKEAILFIVSDHGMRQLKKVFYLNNFLIKEGLLKIKRHSAQEIKHQFVHTVVKWTISWFTRLGLNPDRLKELLPRGAIDNLTNIYCYRGNIDWSQTKAYFLPGQGDGIMINLKGKYPQGPVENSDDEALKDDIIKKLSEIKDPDSKEKNIKNIYRREQLYCGNFVKNAPDLIVEMKSGYRISEDITEGGLFKDIASDPAELISAEHYSDGLIIAYGESIKKCNISDASILDIIPTVLHFFDIPVPDSMDGRVLKEIFKEYSPSAQKEIKYESVQDKQKPERSEKASLTEEEEAKMREVLKRLGYLKDES